MIDLRSDTVTRPTPEMREAIAHAVVGDDVIDVDPTLDALEKATAKLLGKERAIFMPSGSMTNQIAVRVHCKPGEEFICDEGCHIYNYEQGAFAQLSGVVAKTVSGVDGVLQPEQLQGKIRPENEHMVRTRMVTLENTHNRGGGKVQPYQCVVDICQWAHDAGLATHLDGARLMNAVVATGRDAAEWAQHFDTVSICFSKGLGAPVGSALAGSEAAIQEARRHRKAFGGGMRQAGILAAGALYALEHHVERLAEDHEKAQRLADAVRDTPGLELATDEVDTNIVIFQVTDENLDAHAVVAHLKEQDVHMFAIGPQSVRAVTHLDVSFDQIEQACAAIKASAADRSSV